MSLELNRLRQLAISDAGFVFDPVSGHSFTLNATGARILHYLKQGLPPSDIAPRLNEEFDVDETDDPVRDVEDFLLRLREHHLLG